MIKRSMGLCFAVIFIALSCNSAAQEDEKIYTESESDAAIMRAIYPHSPELIVKKRKREAELELATYKEIAEYTESKQVIRINQSPEELSPVVYTLYRSPTDVLFFDASGAPWPILSIEDRDKNLLTANKRKDSDDGNIMTVSTQLVAGRSYLSVLLKDNPLPISIAVAAGSKTFNPSVTITVEKIGPEHKTKQSASKQVQGYLGRPSDEELNNAAAGIKPYGSTVLETSDTRVKAWRSVEGKLIIRTKGSLVQPNQIDGMQASGEYVVYRIDPVSIIMIQSGSQLANVGITL